jgi:hypothetical protein
MRHLSEGTVVLVVAALSLGAVACNKGPAETALAAADQALTAARPELERYLPEDLASLAAAAAEARSRFEEGEYTEALKTAQALPARVQDALAAATARREQLTATWSAIAGSLPGLVESIGGRLSTLTAAKALPKGTTPDSVADAQAGLASLTRDWTAAVAAFEEGDVPKAVATAEDVEARAEALAEALGIAHEPEPH